MFRWFVGVMCVLALGSACGANAASVATLTIGDVEAHVGDSAVVPVALKTNGTQPGTFIFSILFDPARLTYVSTDPGSAILDAGKFLDANLSAPGTLSITIYGITPSSVQDGIVVEVTFDLASGFTSGSTTLSGANVSAATVGGQSVASSIVSGAVSFPCEDVGDAQNVSASQGRTDGILVQWEAGQAATEYQVYRSDSNSPGTAAAISSWSSSLQYLDTTAQAAQSASAGCQPTSTKKYYYYWVRTRNAAECEGALAGPAQGYRSRATGAGLGDGVAALLVVFLLAGPVRRLGRVRP